MDITVLAVTPMASNCCIAVDGETKKAMMVDPGGEADRIFDGVEALGVEIVAIALTHGHADHVGALKEVCDKWPQASRYCSPVAKAYLADTSLNLGSFVGIEVIDVDMPCLLENGDTISIGHSQLRVLALPGHSPGCIGYHFKDDSTELCLCGDTLFLEGIGRTDLPGGDTQTLEDTIRNTLYQLDDACVLYPGHGPCTSVGHEKTANPFVRPEGTQ